METPLPSLPSLSSLALGDRSKLAHSVETKRKGRNEDESALLRLDASLEQSLPYRSLGPPTERANSVAPIRVQSIRIVPRPADAPLPYEIYSRTLEEFAAVVLNVESASAEVLQHRIIAYVRSAMTIDFDMTYTTALTFLGRYVALSIMAIKASGPPEAPWGGPVTNYNLYPDNRAREIWNQIMTSGRTTAVKNVLDHMCSGEPTHPWYRVDDTSRRMDTSPFIDTMGGIVDMTNPTHTGMRRELLIASRDGKFMGHIFVSCAISPVEGIKALFPYGIQRSAFRLPGTCAPPREVGGFVNALFERIDKIARENDATHIFTYPLEKMKARFLARGYTLVPKGSRFTPVFSTISHAVASIFGVGTRFTDYILEREFSQFDFVLLEL